jgi:predicted DsbA family dithiol-disulfide isomerase
VEWRAYLLRPDTPDEGMPHPIPYTIRQQRGAAMRAMMAEAGLTYVENDWVSNSRKALEAAEYARDQGVFDAFHRAVFHAYFSEGWDIGKLEVLEDVAREVGLDPTAVADAVTSGRYTDRVDEDLALAQHIGLRGVPAFIIGNRAIVGAQPYEVFEQVMGLLGAARKSLPGPDAEQPG